MFSSNMFETFCSLKSFLDKTPKKLVKCYIFVKIVKWVLSFCRNDENYTRISNKLFKEGNKSEFSQQLIVVFQNLKFVLYRTYFFASLYRMYISKYKITNIKKDIPFNNHRSIAVFD